MFFAPAEEVRKKALDMELKAKNGDLPGILAGNESLLSEAEALITAIRNWMSAYAQKYGKPKAHAPDITLLVKLRRYCEQSDIRGVDEVMAQIESSDYETDADIVAWISEKIITSEFADVAERIKEYADSERSNLLVAARTLANLFVR